jgi:hypothetical protein
VQDVCLVRCRQTVCDTREQLDTLSPGSRLRGGPTAQSAAIQEFGDDVLFSFPIARVVYRNNVRMIQRGCHLSLALKTSSSVGICDISGQELHRHGPVQLRIESAIDDTHAALAKQGVNPVLPERRSDSDRLAHRGEPSFKRQLFFD